MRVLLINPPQHLRKGSIWHGISAVLPPLGLAWMAAVLQRHGHQVKILDAHAERVAPDAVPEFLQTIARHDLVGITATTSLIGNALAIARRVKSVWPEAMVVLGGAHPTVLPEEALAEPAVDLVARGEGEGTILELAAGRPVEEVHGLSFRRDGQVRHTQPRALIEDLDDLPLPAYHLLPMGRYHPAVGAYKRLPGVSMLATRGCPHQCTYCYRIFGNRLRVRSGRKLAEEAAFLRQEYGIREVCFYDDTFTVVKKQVHEFCRSLAELGVDLSWSCFSRTDAVDEELLRAMKQAGCHQIMYGIESACPEILRNVGKDLDLRRAEDAVRLTRKIGIEVRAAFMFGNPGETEQTMRQTLAFARRMNPDLAMFNISTPYPGTEMHAWAERHGYLRTRDWREYDLAHMVMELPTISSRKVERFYKTAYRKFFLRPRYVGMRLAKIRGLHDVKQVLGAIRALADV